MMWFRRWFPSALCVGAAVLSRLNWRCMDLPRASSSAKDPTPQTTTDPARAAALFEQSVAIMARLRAPGGCPWDREQSFDSIRKYTLEEIYEVFDAIERRDFSHLAEELGDLLLQVLFYAEMAANEGHFTIADVLDHLNRKLIRRHPHVFGDEASRAAGNRADVDAAVEGSAAAVLRNWEEIKAAEKHASATSAADSQGISEGNQPASRLDSVQRAMPALAEAAKLGAKAQKSGFDWPNWRDLLPKLAEETAELEAEASSATPRASRPSRRSWAICCLPSSISAGIWASTRRWLCAAAICASAAAFVRWSEPPRGRSKTFLPMNWKSFGRRPRGNSQAMKQPPSIRAPNTASQAQP